MTYPRSYIASSIYLGAGLLLFSVALQFALVMAKSWSVGGITAIFNGLNSWAPSILVGLIGVGAGSVVQHVSDIRNHLISRAKNDA